MSMIGDDLAISQGHDTAMQGIHHFTVVRDQYDGGSKGVDFDEQVHDIVRV